jgi:predicted Rossmann-fold nucleotide-binding protein
VKNSRGRLVHVASLAAFDRRTAAGARSLSGWRLRGLDLTERSGVLADCHVAGATFLGCTFAAGDAARAEAGGALVLPEIPDVPVDPYRERLYSPADLYDTPAYADSVDARAYAWSQQSEDPEALLAQALHDHAVDVALEEALAGWRRTRRVVGVMGGHALQRDNETYADAARLGRALGAAHVVATGGGPGAMEAANLGAWSSPLDPGVLDQTLAELARVPSYRPSIGAWAEVALGWRERFPDGGESLGIPTWHYGHEPPNVFASAIAKYFRNATREAILLEVCDGGIVFLPGAAGTVQEVFQDACENYYADESAVAPMVLVGRTYWTETLPVWPLLRALAVERTMEGHVHLVDTAAEAAELLTAVPASS